MERLPAELILHIASFLEARDLVPVHLASKHLFKITRDSELWKRFCLDDSHSEAARRRQDFLYGPPIPIQEPRVFELRRAVARSDNNNASPTAETATARAMATWDPTYPDEKVDWYGEYIARHASLSMSWLEQPFNEQNGLRKKSETRGLGIFRNHDDNLVVAPLDDGSVCLWNIGREDAAPNPQDGRIMARSRPGLLSVNGPDGSIPQNPTKSRAKMTSTGVVECVSVDRARNKAYFAVQSGLNEVDLTTLQISSYDRYPFSITALSEATHPVPLTVGTSLSLHLHDPRLGNNGGSPTSWISDRVDTNANASQNPPYSTTDFHRLSSGDSSQTDYATLFHPSPLSILHLNPSSTIYVAGRFPSILNYDRRCFPKLTSTIHSGARLCSISSLPTPNHPTLAAVGEYNGKGSLELYPLDSAFTASPSDSISDQPTRNRTSASRSKLLSLTPHGTRLLFSDSDGQLKWVERDGSSLVRRWNINTFDTSISDSESARSGIFNVDPNEGDVARKLLPVGTGARSEVCVWTGEKIGVLGFKDKPRFSFGVDKDGTCTPEGSSDGESIDERDYERMMRRALERQADEVRFVRGLGLGVEGFMELFVWTDRTGQKEYATIQVEALERWRQWIPTMQAKLDAKDLDPDFFVQLFDACLFGGALRCWTTVDLIDRPSPSLYRSKIQADLERKDHRLTVVLRPDSNTTWTEPTVQHLLSVLLHNMTHAAFWLFAYRCVDCKCLRTEAMTGSIKVHGPSWMELGQAVEKEADQSRLGFKHQWFMCVEPDHVSRKEELTVVTILQKQKGNSRALANC